MIESFYYAGILEIREEELAEPDEDRQFVQIWQVIDRFGMDTMYGPVWVCETPLDQGVKCPANWELA